MPRDDLTKFVRDHMERTGRSVRELSRTARDPESGVRPSHGWIQDIANGVMERAPDLRRLRALAAAMGVDVDHLARLAAAQWLGVTPIRVVEAPVGGDDEETVAVPVPGGMSAADRERLRQAAADLAKHFET